MGKEQHPILDLLAVDLALSSAPSAASPSPSAEDCDVLVMRRTPDGWVAEFEPDENVPD